MAVIFDANAEKSVSGLDAKSDSGFRTMVYKSNGGAGLGGGTLEIFTELEGVKTPVPNSKLTAATLDDNGQAIQQVTFSSAGIVWIHLTGATTPDITVAVR